MTRRSTNLTYAAIGATVLALTQTAFAHPLPGGAAPAGGFFSGLFHPLSGFDHILAMFAVGLWAAQIGGRALWLVPATFVGVMVGGAALGMNGASLPFVESGVLASIIVLGLAIVCALRVPIYAAAAGVGLFALFHGHAHGSEIAQGASAAAYSAGFVLSTALLHALGIVTGCAFQRLHAGYATRWAGAAILAGGIALWATA